MASWDHQFTLKRSCLQTTSGVRIMEKLIGTPTQKNAVVLSQVPEMPFPRSIKIPVSNWILKWGYPSVTQFYRCFLIINHPAIGYPPFVEPPNSSKPSRLAPCPENQLFRMLRADDKEGWQRLMEGKQGVSRRAGSPKASQVWGNGRRCGGFQLVMGVFLVIIRL